MNRRSFFALLTAPFVAKFWPKKQVYKHSITFKIFDDHIHALPQGVTDPVIFLSPAWADKIRAIEGGVLPERYFGYRIIEVTPWNLAD